MSKTNMRTLKTTDAVWNRFRAFALEHRLESGEALAAGMMALDRATTEDVREIVDAVRVPKTRPVEKPNAAGKGAKLGTEKTR